MQQAAVHQAKKRQNQTTATCSYKVPIDRLRKIRGRHEKHLQLQGWGLAESQCSCLCEVRCERALIMSRAESETQTAYIIEEHIVREEVALKHEITSALTSRSLRKASADSG